MDKKQFLATLKKVLINQEFMYKNKGFYFETKELIIVIGTQKSNFMNSYFINFGFKLKDEIQITNLPKDNECDTFGRFIINESDSINYESFNEQGFETLLQDFINRNITPVITEGLSKYYELNPKAIYTAAPKVRKYLNI